MPKKKAWAEHPAPETAFERNAFLSRCAEWFLEAEEAGEKHFDTKVPFPFPLHPPSSREEGEECAMAWKETHSFAKVCVVCGAAPSHSSIVMANPFVERGFVSVCAGCSGGGIDPQRKCS